LGSLLTRAREEGAIDWDWIVHEGRAIESIPTWDDPAAYAQATQKDYRRSRWVAQPKRIIVVSEKGMVRGTLEPVLEELEVDFLAVGGYASATRVHDLAAEASRAQPILLFYLGDWGPSGLGMSEQDLPGRLMRYACADIHGRVLDRTQKRAWDDPDDIRQFYTHGGLELRRIALTRLDTEALGPDLGFPATDKKKDPRYTWFLRYERRRPAWCWELDAMNPTLLRERVAAAIRGELNLVQWERYVAAEAAERESIRKTLSTWKSISGLASE